MGVREATEDLEFKGLAIKNGTTLHLFSESAETDPATFPDAEFNVTVSQKRNFGLGYVLNSQVTQPLPCLSYLRY